ncbi:MAG: SPFH domain-containing protein [Bacteroidota bacterium]|nr:SPFH domain-containing protein [Bacteroidota bacterium]
MPTFLIVIVILFTLFIIIAGAKVIRPTHRGLIERFGKYRKFAHPGLHIILPFIDKMVQINVTEKMVDAQKQEIITIDNLNAHVDAQVYYKIREDEISVKNSQYNVQNIESQIVNLSRTTLRNIIGTLTLKSANSERMRINKDLVSVLKDETSRWGIDIVRAELKEIDPPKDVQDTMNKIVKAENEKVAAIDFATALETQADGQRRAEIKKAEGVKQAAILEAEGKAEALRLVNEAAEKYFVGNAQMLRQIEAVEKSLTYNTKILIPNNGSFVNIINDMVGTTDTIKSEVDTGKGYRPDGSYKV